MLYQKKKKIRNSGSVAKPITDPNGFENDASGMIQDLEFYGYRDSISRRAMLKTLTLGTSAASSRSSPPLSRSSGVVHEVCRDRHDLNTHNFDDS